MLKYTVMKLQNASQKDLIGSYRENTEDQQQQQRLDLFLTFDGNN